MQLQRAFDLCFSEPVTAYLTSACIAAGCCLGVTHRHAKADPDSGRFGDGHLIRTSDIVRIDSEHSYLRQAYRVASVMPVASTNSGTVRFKGGIICRTTHSRCSIE